MRARIVGYDAPELFSPMCEAERVAAERARAVLATWVRHATATEVAFLGHDRYRRTLVDMRLSGQRVAEGMVGERERAAVLRASARGLVPLRGA